MKGRCKHFNGTMNKACDAGICYADVRVAGEPKEHVGRDRVTSLPCLDKYNLHGATCAKREVQTEEELAAEELRFKQSMERVLKARKAIVDAIGPYKKGESRSVSGGIQCPNCNGVLTYSRAGLNGHIHATCRTEGCVSWME